MNKKGTVDNIWAMAQTFGLAIFFLTILFIWSQLTAPEVEAEIWDHNAYTQNIQQNIDKAYAKSDFIFLMVYFGMHLGILATSYLLRSHPVVLVAIFLIALCVALISPILSNVYGEILEITDFSGVKSDIPMTTIIMNNLPLFEVIWTFVTGIVLIGLARTD